MTISSIADDSVRLRFPSGRQSAPNRISIAVNKNNLSEQIIRETGVFNVSVLTEDADFGIFKKFGFTSGREQDKFTEDEKKNRTANGLTYYAKATNAVISAKVVDTIEPDPELVAKYNARYEQFRKIYPTVKELFPQIA